MKLTITHELPPSPASVEFRIEYEGESSQTLIKNFQFDSVDRFLLFANTLCSAMYDVIYMLEQASSRTWVSLECQLNDGGIKVLPSLVKSILDVAPTNEDWVEIWTEVSKLHQTTLSPVKNIELTGMMFNKSPAKFIVESRQYTLTCDVHHATSKLLLTRSISLNALGPLNILKEYLEATHSLVDDVKKPFKERLEMSRKYFGSSGQDCPFKHTGLWISFEESFSPFVTWSHQTDGPLLNGYVSNLRINRQDERVDLSE